MKEAFKAINEKDSYYDLLIKMSNNNWLSSRCIDVGSTYCIFNMGYVCDGSVGACNMCNLADFIGNHNLALFPVVSLNASSITGDKTAGFTVELN